MHRCPTKAWMLLYSAIDGQHRQRNLAHRCTKNCPKGHGFPSSPRTTSACVHSTLWYAKHIDSMLVDAGLFPLQEKQRGKPE